MDNRSVAHPPGGSQLARVRALAYETCGLDLGPAKEALVEARIAKHMRELGVTSVADYLARVQDPGNRAALDGLISALTTNHTSFLREQEHFDVFRREVLARSKPDSAVTVWCAASSSGEEPYTLAMTACEEFGAEAPSRVRILATDVSLRVLGQAREAVYSDERLGPVPSEWRRKYFLKGSNRWKGFWRVKPEIRQMVRLERLNLIEPLPSFPAQQAIFCRNVMIYFDAATRQAVVRRLVDRLARGGYLFVGHAESLHSLDEDLAYVRPSVYRRTGGGAK